MADSPSRPASHVALARRYRPRTFAEVAVQTHVSQTLRGAIGRGRVAQGYLLCGPRGVGKTTLARVLAMALNCENRRADGEPCGECQSCRRIWAGSTSLDVVEIDAASNRGVDDARDLRERAMYAPSGDDRYKVYIVDEAHMLTREAWNALLKILEEPPPRVVFVFATTEPQKIAQQAAPVLSRLQRFDFRRIGAADIRDRLAKVLREEGVEATPDALGMLARAADGSMRDALSLTDQVLSIGEGTITPERVQEALGLVPEDEFVALLDLIAERRAGDVFGAVARLADAGVDFGSLLGGLGAMIRAQLAIALGGEAPDVSERAQAALAERRERTAAPDLLRMLAALTSLEPQFRKSGQQRLLVETLLVRFALLDRTVDIERVLRELGGPAAAGAPSAGRGAAGSGPGAAGPRSDREPMSPRVPATPSRQRGMAAARGDAEVAVMAGPPAPADVEPPPSGGALAPLETHRLAERWDDIVAEMGSRGRSTLAGVLGHMTPVAVTARGDVTIELDEANDIAVQAFTSGKDELLRVIQSKFGGVQGLSLRVPSSAPATPAARRMTQESLRAERVAQLRRKDPVLGAAIDALDLELLE